MFEARARARLAARVQTTAPSLASTTTKPLAPPPPWTSRLRSSWQSLLVADAVAGRAAIATSAGY